VQRASFRFVRHNDANETVLRSPRDEADALADLAERSARLGTRVAPDGDEAVCELSAAIPRIQGGGNP
jgi:hypothetical protein